MAEGRERPRYGEYASPEDQARATGLTDAPPSIHAPVPIPAPAVAVSAAVPSVRPRRWDRILSIALLAYGLISVVFGAPTYADLPRLVRTVYTMQNVGQFTSDDFARSIGTAIIAVDVVLYILVFTLTMMRLRAGRIAFFIPLIGGVIAAIAAIALVSTVMIADPAFQEYIRSSQ